MQSFSYLNFPFTCLCTTFLFRPLPDHEKGVKHAVGFATSYLGSSGYLEQCPASFVSALTTLAFTWVPMPLPLPFSRDSPAALSWAKCDFLHLLALAPDTSPSLLLLQQFSSVCVINCAFLGFNFPKYNPIKFLSFGNISHFLLFNNVLDSK